MAPFGRMKARLALLALATLGAALFAATAGVRPAAAISHGSLDGDAHPAVVMLLLEVNGQPSERCSGVLLDSTDVLTAGHCVGEPGEFSDIFVYTESSVDGGANHFPACPPSDYPNCIVASHWAALPGFTEADFSSHDVGMVKLSQPFVLPPGDYGTLPVAGALDGLDQKTTFTAVGYGAETFSKVTSHIVAPRVRQVAFPQLLQLNTGASGPGDLIVSANANTGGTCFGDSGGPNFLPGSLTIAGVTSFGVSQTCGGVQGVFRLDKADVLAFVAGFRSGP